VEEVEHQQGLFQTLGGNRTDNSIAQQINQRLDVIATDHGAQKLGRTFARQGVNSEVAVGHSRQERCLDLGRIVHAGRDAICQEIEQLLDGFVRRRRLDQLDQVCGLLSRKRQRRNAEGCAFGDMKTIGFEHGRLSGSCRDKTGQFARQTARGPFPHKE